MIVFVDRDGVINQNRDDYVKTVDEFVIIPEALSGLAKLNSAGIKVVVVSNQAGLGYGKIGLLDLARIERTMFRIVEENGGRIEAVFYCPHRKGENCDCRKPKIGLFKQASQDLEADLTCSYFIGDAETDIEAGQRAGLTTILVLTGRSSASDVANWTHKPDHIALNLDKAVDWILSEK